MTLLVVNPTALVMIDVAVTGVKSVPMLSSVTAKLYLCASPSTVNDMYRVLHYEY